MTASALVRLLAGAPPWLRSVVSAAAFEAAIASEAARPHSAHPPPTNNRRCRRRRRRTSRLITDGCLRLFPGEASVPGGVQPPSVAASILDHKLRPNPRSPHRWHRGMRGPTCAGLSGALRPPLIEAARRAGEEAAASAYADTVAIATGGRNHRRCPMGGIDPPHDMSDADQAFALSGGIP